MESIYNEIIRFMEEYFPAYNECGQIAGTQSVMDKFYAPDLSMDGGVVSSREQWYKRCLAHPAVQDKLTVEHLFVDEKQREVGALLKTQAIDRATGKILLELKLYVFYSLKIDHNNELKIMKVKVFLESDPSKVTKLSQLYAIGVNKTQ